MTDEAAWTIGRLLAWTTEFLKQHRAEQPRLEAEVLLSAAKGCQRIELYANFDEIAAEELRTRFRELVRKRAGGAPVAYLVGHREFYSLDFLVTPDVLIPRPETELLVIALLDLVKARGAADAVCDVADVGAGSGVIAVCAAKKAACRVTALDVSRAALDIARRNVERHGVTDRVTLIESDLMTALPDAATFDYVVSNPPYVSSSEMTSLPADVREHEPRLALEAGPSGTEVIERLIPAAAARLRSGGALLLEISPMIEARVRELIAAEPRLALRPTIKDLAGLPRVVVAARSEA